MQSYGRLHFKNLLASPLVHCSLRPVKPCPGVPCVYPNTESTVSRTAAHRCCAGRHLCTKFRRCKHLSLHTTSKTSSRARPEVFYSETGGVWDGTNAILNPQRDLKRVETPYPSHYRSSSLCMRPRCTCKEWKTSQTIFLQICRLLRDTNHQAPENRGRGTAVSRISLILQQWWPWRLGLLKQALRSSCQQADAFHRIQSEWKGARPPWL